MHPLLHKRHTFISPLAIHHIIERHGLPKKEEREREKERRAKSSIVQRREREKRERIR